MKSRFKKLLLWSSVGSLAAVALVRRSRRRPEVPLKCVKIPPDCRRACLWTEHFQTEGNGTALYACDRYVLQATQFKVWSILGRDSRPDSSPPQGAAVFHVTHSRSVHPPESALERTSPREQLVDRFYGTVRTVGSQGHACAADSVARGGILEIRKCRAGGAAYGVETGEVHRSAGRILNYRFECARPGSEAASGESRLPPVE